MQWRAVVVLAMLALAVPVSQTLTAFDTTLHALHGPDEPSYGVSSLSGVGFHPDWNKPKDVVGTWRRADTAFGETQPHTPVSTTAVLGRYFLFDLLFMVAYGVGLALLALLLRARIVDLVEEDEERFRSLAGAAADDEDADTGAWRVARHGLLAREALLAAAWVTAAVVAADLVEDASSWWLGDHSADHWAHHGTTLHTLFVVAFVAAWLKLVLAAFAVLAIVVGALWVAVLDRAAGRLRLRALWVLRAQLVLLALLAFLLFGSVTADQGADAMLRWKDRPWEAAYAIMLALLLGAVLALSARELLRTTRVADGPWPKASRRAWFALAVALILVGAAGFWPLSYQSAKTWLALGIALLVICLLNAWAAPLASAAPPPRSSGTLATAVLAGAPLALVGLALLRPSVVEMFYADRSEYWGLLGVAVASYVAGCAIVAAAWMLRGRTDVYVERLFLLVAGGVAVLGLGAAVWTEPLSFPPAVGTIGVATAALVVFGAVVAPLGWLAERFPPPPVFGLLRLRRTPVFLLLLAWAVIAGSTQTGAYYDARTKPGKPKTLDLPTVFDRWKMRLGRDGMTPPKGLPAGVKPGIPMVFVTTAGGGIRASYWTSIALQCIFEPGAVDDCASGEPQPRDDARRFFFAASGVSGGSVGLAQYVAHVASHETRSDWPDVHAGDDEASATLAWFLFTDVPSAFVSRSNGSDRAEMLERTWERSWPEQGEDNPLAKRLDEVDEIGATGMPVPLLLLNSTRVQDGCRLNVSVLVGTAAAGGDDGRVSDCLTVRHFRGDERPPPWTFASTQDLHAYLCDSEVRLSTAALLSARFPWVSPSGRIPPCGAKENAKDKNKRLVPANAVDGGYFDTSAASAIVELWDHLRFDVERFNRDDNEDWCLVPLLVELDNHYAGYPAPLSKKPWETNVPLSTVQAARNAREANARQAAALAFGGPLASTQDVVLLEGAAPGAAAADLRPLNRFAELRPAAHPGTEAPLGWALSSASREDLRNQLIRPSPAQNPKELRRIHQWLRPGAIGCRAAKP